jgi:hypothetical protein
MMRLSCIVRHLVWVLMTLYCGWGHGAPVLSQASQKSLESVVQKFAGSYILGTGASHFVTGIQVIDVRHAVAVVGETSDSGRDPHAYTVHVRQINHQWKIVKYEFVMRQTGKKESRDQLPPFPYKNWEKDAP